ncbi:MAG: DoxX family protein [Rhodoferax sp.]|nr:MAG: DoxX family protein [Rhodoferax sp.]
MSTPGPLARARALLESLYRGIGELPNTALAFVARFSMAAVFWKSGQTKVEGFALDIVSGEFQWGWLRLSDNAVALFREEYKLPFLSPEMGAWLAATGEHVLPALLLLGLATRLSALGLLGMTLVIQLLVYPGAYPTHGTWMAVLLYLMVHGPGQLSLDAWLYRNFHR